MLDGLFAASMRIRLMAILGVIVYFGLNGILTAVSRGCLCRYYAVKLASKQSRFGSRIRRHHRSTRAWQFDGHDWASGNTPVF